MRHDSPCCHFAPRSAAPGRGHLRTKMVPQGNVASLRRYATFAQIRSVVVATASIEMAPKRLSLVNLRLGSEVSVSASPSSRPIKGRRPHCFKPRTDPPGARGTWDRVRASNERRARLKSRLELPTPARFRLIWGFPFTPCYVAGEHYKGTTNRGRYV